MQGKILKMTIKKKYIGLIIAFLILISPKNIWSAEDDITELLMEPEIYSFTVQNANLSRLQGKHGFNDNSANLFLELRNTRYAHLVDCKLDQTITFRHYVHDYLKSSESFPQYCLENNSEIIYALQELLQERKVLLNYVMILGTKYAYEINKFSVYFPNADSAKLSFIDSLVNIIDEKLKIKMSPKLKEEFSTLNAWEEILYAFSEKYFLQIVKKAKKANQEINKRNQASCFPILEVFPRVF